MYYRHYYRARVAGAPEQWLAFLGSVHGAPVVPLGVDQFGQSRLPSDLYALTGIGAADIVAAAYLARDLAQDG